MKRIIVGLSMLLLSSFAWALPTLQQVETEVQQGHYAQAETMMSEVVAAKPDSPKAHYIYAEVLAHNANFKKASDETAKARSLDPSLKFTDAEKFRSFEQTLQRELNPPARVRTTTPTYAPATQVAPATTSSSTGIPGWVWLVGLVVLAIVLWRGFMRSQAMSGGNVAANNGMQGGYGPGMSAGPQYGPYGQGGAPVGRPGSGLLGTGLAVAGGVAGGMLLDEMLHKRSDSGNNNFGGLGPDNYNPGSDNAANQLENRPIDFGNGNDWDSGGGGSDLGGGGSDGGGGWD